MPADTLTAVLRRATELGAGRDDDSRADRAQLQALDYLRRRREELARELHGSSSR